MQAENYFVKDNYYAETEQHEASFWAGKGAAHLGLTGTVGKTMFSELLSELGPNRQVISGQKIDPKKRRAATDFTFSALKSVSIAALVQQDERVLAARHQAVEGTFCAGRVICPDADFDRHWQATADDRELYCGSVSPCDELRGGATIA